MREERGQLVGNQVISEGIDLWGTVSGNVSVVRGGKVYLRGAIYGNLHVLDGGRVHVFGNISGDLVVEEGAKVIHGGILGGDAVNNGGRLFLDATAQVIGKLRKRAGTTDVDRKAVVGGTRPGRPDGSDGDPKRP